MTRVAAALVFVAVLVAGACAPKTAPPPAVGALRYPDFVYPAVPARSGDTRTLARQEAAWRLLQSGDLRGAEMAFTQLADQQPAFYPAAAGLGYTLVASGRAKEALLRFDGLLRQAPRYAPALAGRAEALLAAGRRDEALAGFRAALAADPSLADLKHRVDVLAFERVQERIGAARRAADAGRLDEARVAYAAAIEVSPQSAFLYRDLGLVELRRRDLPEADRVLRKAVALDPGDARAHAALADVHEAQGNIDDAIGALERALALDPSDAWRERLDRLREGRLTGALPAEYASIPRAAQLTRGDLAALLGVRLQNVLSAGRGRSAAVATDIRGHWASRWILDVVRAGVMDVFPNHTFQPATLVRRSDLALAASRVLGLAGGGGGRPAPGGVTIRDVGPDHLAYREISAAVASGVMSLDGGSFRPSRAVTGQEAVEAVGRLERLAARGPSGR